MKCELGTPHDHARGPKQVDVISELMDTGYINVNREFDPTKLWLPNKGQFISYGRARIKSDSFMALRKRLREAGYVLVACRDHENKTVAYGWRKEER